MTPASFDPDYSKNKSSYDKVVHIYNTKEEAEEAVERLKAAGYADKDIAILANTDRPAAAAEEGAAAGAATAGVIGAGAGVLAGLGLMAIPGFGPIVAAGWLAATATGALAGAAGGAVAGGLIGALMSHGIPEDMAQAYAEALRRGMYLVSVRVPLGGEPRVHEILDRDGLIPVDMVARTTEWRGSGWTY